MASDNLGPVQPHRMIFQGQAVHFSLTAGDRTPPGKPAAASGFPAGGDQNRFVASQFCSQNPRWNLDHRSQSDRSDDEDDDDDVVDDDDEDEDLDDGDGYSIKNGNANCSGSAQSGSEKGNGMSRRVMTKDGKLRGQHEGVVNYENAITVVAPDFYGGQILNGGDGSGDSGSIRKENGNGFGGRKEVEFLVDPWATLRMHLLDPITGVLMDDAMILTCGHSFGHGGMLRVFKMKACCKCSHPISEDLVRPNLALRSAVQAFKREEASQSSKLSNRGKERLEQEKCNHENPYPMESRTKQVRFPFVVSDRVIIKGNKRTPQRFIGRVGVVTTQCLNGWYVVKTDNAESVKLQYRSLAKFIDNSPSSMIQSKSITPNWL